MNLSDLIQFFLHQDKKSFSLNGTFGNIRITTTLHNKRKTYQISCKYKQLTPKGWHSQQQVAEGFRLSTACCLAACIMFGEERVTPNMISKINREISE